MTPTTLAIALLTSAIGVAYFIYGKRQTRYAPLLAGLMLCVYPYFVDSVTWLVVIGVALIAAPFLLDF
jgi:multisubunit Na+/H+ antiporter MnhC subunit